MEEYAEDTMDVIVDQVVKKSVPTKYFLTHGLCACQGAYCITYVDGH